MKKCAFMYLPLFVFILAFAGIASADMRMELDDSECHFVDPPPNDNADNELKVSTCNNSIHENDDAQTASGSVIHKLTYPTTGAMPYTESVTFSGNGGNINCNLTDGGDTYTTTNWIAKYDVYIPPNRRNKKDDDDHGKKQPSITYTLVCTDAPKQ